MIRHFMFILSLFPAATSASCPAVWQEMQRRYQFLAPDVPYSCAVIAELRYGISRDLQYAFHLTEGGRVGTASVNQNKSVDYGPMQINNVHLTELSRYGITAKDLQWNACSNWLTGAYMAARSIQRSGDIWVGIGNYHHHIKAANNKHHFEYRARFWRNLERLRRHVYHADFPACGE